MRDYHIYSHYVENEKPKTSVQHESATRNKLSVEEKAEKKLDQQIGSAMTKTVATTVLIANKVNSYVGELTENVITQRKVSVGLTAASMVTMAIRNPVLAGISAATYFGDKAIQYQIKQYKENSSAAYLRTVANGVATTGR